MRTHVLRSLAIFVGFLWRVGLLPPTNEVCEGYDFTPVCHSVHRGCLGPGPGGRLVGLVGGCLYPDTRGRLGVWWGGCPGTHLGEGMSRPRPRGSRPSPGGGCIPACTEADTPQQTATAAGGTHPTGMHCCSLCN